MWLLDFSIFLSKHSNEILQQHHVTEYVWILYKKFAWLKRIKILELQKGIAYLWDYFSRNDIKILIRLSF